MKAKLRAVSAPDAEYAARAGSVIRRQLLDLSEFRNAKNVFCYVSTDSEPETRGIITQALKLGKRVAVPVCHKKPLMTAHMISGFDGLSKNRYGIYEPPVTAPEMPKPQIDIAIVPCVRADKRGGRLGHGAGYYDRFLSDTDCFKVCLCFEARIIDCVPMDINDVLMDCVITENGVFYTA